MTVFVVVGILQRIWRGPVWEYINFTLAGWVYLLLFLLLYLTWRDTHSWRQVIRQNLLYLVICFVLPFLAYLLFFVVR